MMEWPKLLCDTRLGRESEVADPQIGRSPFQQDIDRIVFSGAFRRLAHKTQVHPLSENDNVHTRLTHSIEVASVGRSLGTNVGGKIAERLKIPTITADTFGYIVQAACLAHDIGNPPFGHSGEDAIGNWFKRDHKELNIFAKGVGNAEKNDFKLFEGNAQGFRILTQLENYRWSGGLQLTYAVLGTFSKYPCSSAIKPIPNETYVGAEKIGFFESERPYFEKIAGGLGLIKKSAQLDYWCRHPLAFLVEAADDICYAIIDIEDGYELGYLSFEEARKVLVPMAKSATLSTDLGERGTIGKLRAVAIGELVKAASEAFLENESALLSGTFDGELVKKTPFGEHISNAKSTAKQKIYWSDRKTKLEIAGSVIITGLLNFYHEVVLELEAAGWEQAKLNGQPQKLARLIPNGFDKVKSRYDAWLRVTDFIAGMTDRYALDLYRKLSGISI